MTDLYTIAVLLFPWFSLLVLIVLAKVLIKWARAQHVGAFAFGAIIQMLLPDPYAERTIKIVQEAKKEVKEKENEQQSQL